MNTTVRKFHLGKQAPKAHPHTLKLAAYLPQNRLPAAPASIDWGAKVSDWGILGNDKVGDCTCAGAAHIIQQMTANAGTEVVPQTADVLAAYSAITGYDPSKPGTDNGAALTDVLAFWRDTGICGHKIAGWAQVNRLNQAEVLSAMNIFGGLYGGLRLPLSAEAQVGTLWDLVLGSAVAGAPGGWGGHCIDWLKGDANRITCNTWGQLQAATWAFFQSYTDEAYVVFTQDWLDAQGESPSGVNGAQMQADLSALQASTS